MFNINEILSHDSNNQALNQIYTACNGTDTEHHHLYLNLVTGELDYRFLTAHESQSKNKNIVLAKSYFGCTDIANDIGWDNFIADVTYAIEQII